MIRGGMTVTVRGWRGIAFRVRRRRGSEVEAIMIGDDRVHRVHADDCRPLARSKYCGECGQIGCAHDGLAR